MEILISFAFATTALALSPGPDNIFVLTQSLVNGKKYGLATVFGLISGCIIHTTLLVFGISIIIKNSETLFFGIKLFGTFYLLFLAFKVFQSDASIVISKEKHQKKSTTQLFKQGFIMNVLNPKVTLFFLAFFPRFLFSDTMDSVYQFYILGGIFMLISLLIFSSIVFLAGMVSNKIQKNKQIGIVLKWTQIIVFIGIAVFILIP